MTTTTFGSVCTGIGAPEVAWGSLGWQPVWMAEIEAHPSTILAHHYPRVPNMGDMTKLPALVRMGLLPAPDVLVGGTPCQAFSIAGLRGGLTDERGQLTLTYVDLANAIDEQRDEGDECIAVWENVPGVLSDSTNAFGYFLAGLAGEDGALECAGNKWPNAGVVVGPQRAIGWRVLDAQYFGVAQRRRRVFVVASAREGFDPAAILFELESVRRDSPPKRGPGQETAGTLASRTGAGGFPGTDEACSGYLQPTLTCASNAEGSTGLPFLTCSNIAKTVNNQTPPLAFSCKDYGADASVDIAPTMRAMGHSGSHANAGGQLAVAFRVHGEHSTAMTGNGNANVADPVDLARCLDTSGGYATNQGGNVVLQPVAYENDGVTYRDAMGMAHWPDQVQCITGDITHTLKAEGFDASEDGTGRGQPIVTAFKAGQSEAAGGIFLTEEFAPTLQAQNNGSTAVPAIQYGMAVRRLTPRECERLQGFPDDYTLVPLADRRQPARGTDRRGEVRMMADGPRYKALGNSMCVDVMRWLGRRLVEFGAL